MTEHRLLQRTLFRMYADAGFAGALLAREPRALASTGLGPGDLELLMDLDPRALRADPGGRRRSQLLGNCASEFSLGLAAFQSHAELASPLNTFLESAHFHGAMIHAGRLPLAFGNHALEQAVSAKLCGPQVMLRLELEMAHLRRGSHSPTIPSPHPLLGNWPVDLPLPSSVPEIPEDPEPLGLGCVRLAATARLIALPLGALNWASELQAALDRSSLELPSAPPWEPASEQELVLLKALPAASAFQLSSVESERLSSPTRELLERARRPLSKIARDDFAEAHGAAPQELESFVQELVADRILDHGC